MWELWLSEAEPVGPPGGKDSAPAAHLSRRDVGRDYLSFPGLSMEEMQTSLWSDALPVRPDSPGTMQLGWHHGARNHEATGCALFTLLLPGVGFL